MLAVLAEVVDELEVPAHGDTICQLLGLIDRLDAKVTEAIGRFDHEGLWELDACTSMTAWLKHRARLSPGTASRMVRMGRRLRDLELTAREWTVGDLSSAQVEAVLANVKERHVDLFAAQEAALI